MDPQNEDDFETPSGSRVNLAPVETTRSRDNSSQDSAERETPNFHMGRRPPTNVSSIKFLQEARSSKLTFSGSSNESGREFLLRLEELCTLFNLSSRDLMAVLPQLLTGSALRWYRNQGPAISWDNFYARFYDAYLPREQDADLLQKILQRRQAKDERPHHFVTTIAEMNAAMDNPLAMNVLLSMIKNNLLPDYQHKIGNMEFVDVQDLITECLRIETLLKRIQRFEPPPTELLQDADFGVPDFRPASRREPLQDRRAQAAFSVNAVTSGCYNCNQPGHFYKDCPFPKSTFCKLCGKKGTSTSDCCRRFVRPAPQQVTNQQSPSTTQTDQKLAEIADLLKTLLSQTAKNSTRAEHQ